MVNHPNRSKRRRDLSDRRGMTHNSYKRAIRLYGAGAAGRYIIQSAVYSQALKAGHTQACAQRIAFRAYTAANT